MNKESSSNNAFSIIENYNDKIDVLSFLKVLWSNKIILIVITSIFAFGAVIYSLSLPNKYTSYSVLKFHDDDQSSNLSSMLGSASGLASMAGISLPNQSSNKSEYVITLIKSKEFLKSLLKYENTKENLVAAIDFNFSKNEIIYDDNIYDSIKKEWTRKIPSNRKKVPSYIEVHEDYYLKFLSASIDKKSGFIRIDFEHVSPFFAEEFIKNIIFEVNNSVKLSDISESNKAIEYLQSRSDTTNQSDVKKSISSLISIELKKLMIANMRDDYLITPIDMPFTPELKSSPARASICVFYTIIGFILAIIVVIFREYIKKED